MQISVEDIHEITWDLRTKHGIHKGKVVETLSKTMLFFTVLTRESTSLNIIYN